MWLKVHFDWKEVRYVNILIHDRLHSMSKDGMQKDVAYARKTGNECNAILAETQVEFQLIDYATKLVQRVNM